MPDRTSPLTAADMIAMLRRHYLPEGRPPGGVFAPEIGSPCGTRRADLIWLSTTISGGRHMVGHEVKVSRSDVIAELNDPSKADPWAQYCDLWYLVISDPALIEGLDIPEVWGIMAPPSGRRTRSMTIIRKAPKLNPSAAPNGVARVTAWLNQRYIEVAGTIERETAWRERELNRLRERVTELEGGAPRTMSPAVKRAYDIARLVEKGLRESEAWGARVTDDEIVSALVDLAVIRERGRQVIRGLDAVRRGTDTIQQAIRSLPDIPDEDTLFGGVA